MNNADDKLRDQIRPIAYDADGNPLYAEPPKPPAESSFKTFSSDALNEAIGRNEVHQYVHVTRAVEPEAPKVSDEVRRRHNESLEAFPELNLSDHEYIISVVRRHPIGMFPAIITSSVMISMVLAALFNFDYLVDTFRLPESSYSSLLLLGIVLVIVFILGGYVSIWVYIRNTFFLTNESVIQEIQTSIFSRTEQTVSLLNIEDASFNQHGILQTMFDYGSIRLSTEGDETTYRFSYVANPKRQIAILNNAVESFKTGRPISED